MLRKETIEKKVKDYLKKLPVKIYEAILFGSSVKGDRLVDSDIDLIVISDDFTGMSFPERFLILQKNWDDKVMLEAFGFTRDEFNKLKSKSIVLQEANEYGMRLGKISKRKPQNTE